MNCFLKGAYPLPFFNFTLSEEGVFLLPEDGLDGFFEVVQDPFLETSQLFDDKPFFNSGKDRLDDGGFEEARFLPLEIRGDFLFSARRNMLMTPPTG